MNYSLTEIAKIIKAKKAIQSDIIVNEVFIDSRKNVNPLNSIFFAIKGERKDGHSYIKDLFKRGFRNFVVEKPLPLKANFLVVKNSLEALQNLSISHRSQFNYPVIGVTGSNGKTIVKEWLYQLLWKDLYIVRSPKSYNSQVGVPLSVLQMSSMHQLGIFEAGISKPGEMQNLEKIIAPTIGIFTNIGTAHNEGFTSIEQKIKEKLQLFKNCKVLLYNEDFPLLNEEIHALNIKKITWSLKNKQATLFISQIKISLAETEIKGVFKKRSISIRLPFIDGASIENTIHCWLYMLCQGYSDQVIQERMLELNPVEMRLQLKEGVKSSLLINDTYNSDLNSLNIALDFMNQMQSNKKKKILVLSDILQSGKSEQTLLKEIAKTIKNHRVDEFIGIGELFKNQKLVKGHSFKNTSDFITQIDTVNIENAIILLKGARSFQFENIIKKWEKRTHETRLEIDLKAIESNLNFYKTLVSPKSKIMVMQKAFSYGHGSHEIAKIMEYNRVDYIGVAYTDEAIDLRLFGIKTPIMIMNPESYQYDSLHAYNLEPVIYSFRIIDELKDYFAKYPEKQLNTHIELDTGMHRLGFNSEDIEKLRDEIKKIKNITVKSIFSHLKSSENPKDDKVTLKQIALFKKMSEPLKKAYPKALLHIANSAGIERFKEAHFDMVRLGIGIYGISSDPEIQQKLKPVSKMITSISQIRSIQKNDSVGYGAAHCVSRKTLVATIPVGYADGINRKMGQGMVSFFVNGYLAKTLGNICMDMCMIDVTDIPQVKEGDEVVLYGEENPSSVIAKATNTIAYEIFTSVSARVKRVYFNE